MKYLVIQPDGEMKLCDARPGTDVIPGLNSFMGSTAEYLSAEMVVGLEFMKSEGLVVVSVKNRDDFKITELEVTDFT